MQFEPMIRAKNLRVEQAEKTRAALLVAARDLFAEKGYFATGTHEIVERAGLTRGALYHHFPQKEDLFRAVFLAVQSDLLDRASMETAVAGDGSQWLDMKARLAGFISSAKMPEVQRILLQDGPAVLGWTEWRALEAHFGLGIISRALEDGMLSGQVRRQPIKPLSLLILAIIDEASLYVANAEDSDQSITDATLAIDTILANLS